jgi:transposase
MKIADPVVKACPACNSERTTVVERRGFEKLLAMNTRLLKYACEECGKTFEAADRRRFKRSGLGARGVHRG